MEHDNVNMNDAEKQDLAAKIQDLDMNTIDLINKGELEFAFKNKQVKDVVIYSEDASEYSILIYFGIDKPLLAYGTTEPERPAMLARMQTVINILSRTTKGALSATFYIKQLPDRKDQK